MEKLKSKWQALQAVGSATLFQSFEWNLLAARIFKDREEPFVVYAETDSGAALIPGSIRIRDRALTLLGEELFDYRDYLHAGAPAVAQEAWRELQKLKLPFSAKAVRLDARLWESSLTKQSFTSAPQLTGVSAAAFVSAHVRSASRVRRILRKGVHLRCLPGNTPGLEKGGLAKGRLAKWVYAQKARGHAQSLFRDPLRLEFLEEVCKGEDCEIFLLEAEVNPIAAMVTFRDGGVRRFYTTWFDPAWQQYSPGIALLYQVSEQTLAEGAGCDYLTGDQPYKMRFANAAVPLFTIESSAEEFGRAQFQDLVEANPLGILKLKAS